jgi:hypothetical protein
MRACVLAGTSPALAESADGAAAQPARPASPNPNAKILKTTWPAIQTLKTGGALSGYIKAPINCHGMNGILVHFYGAMRDKMS